MPAKLAPERSLFGVSEPAPENKSVSPLATGPEPEEYVQLPTVLKLLPEPPTQVSVLAANADGANSATAAVAARIGAAARRGSNATNATGLSEE